MIRVAQCWDDGDVTDIRLAELFRKYNAKATFNLCPGLFHPTRRISRGSYNGFARSKLAQQELKSVYHGFQVASHTMTHVNAGSVPDEDFLRETLDARHFLENLFQQECRGFAWPCGRYTPETIRLLKRAGFAYGRTTANTENVIPCDEPMTLHSSCHFLNPEFRRIFERVAARNGTFYFWGHSYEMMDCSQRWERFEEMLRMLSEDPDVEWVDVIDLIPHSNRDHGTD